MNKDQEEWARETVKMWNMPDTEFLNHKLNKVSRAIYCHTFNKTYGIRTRIEATHYRMPSELPIRNVIYQ